MFPEQDGLVISQGYDITGVCILLGGMSLMAGALGWRATGCSGAKVRAGKVEELLCL